MRENLIERLIQYVKLNSIITTQNASEELNVARQTASKYLYQLKKSGVIEEIHIGGVRIFVLKKLLEGLKRSEDNERK